MWDIVLEAVLFAVSIGLGYSIAYFMPNQDTLLLGTLLSLCFYSTGQYIKFVKNFIKISASVDGIDGRLINIESRSSLRSSIIEKVMSAFEIKDQLIRESVLQGIKDFSQAISTRDDGVVLQGDQLAIKTYEFFWILLIEEQKKNKSEGLQSLTVRVTHSTSINIWKSRRSSALLELQRKFIREGGEILRVLIRPGERKESLEDYRATTELMRKFGINVYMLEIDYESEMSYDYLIVDDLNYIFQWNSDVIGRNISGCEIYRSIYKYNDFVGDWRTVIASLERSKSNNNSDEHWKYDPSPKSWDRLFPPGM